MPARCCWTVRASWVPTRRCAIIFVLPYRKVLHFGIQTAGFGDPVQASQLTVCFADAHEAKFGFIGQQELFAVANAISRCIL